MPHPVDARASGAAALILMLACAPLGARAQAPAPPATPTAGAVGDPESVPDVAMVQLDGRQLFRIRGYHSNPAAQRARSITSRIARAAGEPAVSPDSVRSVESDVGTQLMAGDRLLLVVTDQDAELESVSRVQAAWIYKLRIKQAIEAYRLDRSPGRLLGAGARAAGATLALVLLWFLLGWATRRSRAAIRLLALKRVRGVKIQSLELVRAETVTSFLEGALRLVRLLAVLALLFIYLDYVLSLFPWTRATAAGMFGYVFDPLRTMGTAFVDYLPNLLFLAVLILVTKLVLTVLRLITSSIELGRITLSGFQPEWAWPTYRLVRIGVVAFAVVVAFPYIPGSDSLAFKGVSIFVGVLFSLGSSSLIGNIIAGYTLIYWRALRVGDRVLIGDVLGEVTATRLLVTHVRTPKNEEVVIPNSTIMTGKVVNYSALAKSPGLILHTTVGIGYETPWRQVEAMLLIAAERTPGVLKDPRPFVLQRALGDFAVTYEINAYTDAPSLMLKTYHELHRNILDLFNEYGVQIMTPAYEGDPEQPKVVAKQDWNLAPAAPEGAAPPAPKPAS